LVFTNGTLNSAFFGRLMYERWVLSEVTCVCRSVFAIQTSLTFHCRLSESWVSPIWESRVVQQSGFGYGSGILALHPFGLAVLAMRDTELLEGDAPHLDPLAVMP